MDEGRTTMTDGSGVVVLDLDEMRLSPTACLFEGGPRAGVGVSMFIVRTPPGSAVELHTHPYPETFVLLEGHGRWTAGDEVVELRPNQMLVVPPETAHGFRNVGEQPLLVVSVHEAGAIEQSWFGRDPA
jgi:mannose-6-phosphate isomerase-like protein (cupin superfamily)